MSYNGYSYSPYFQQASENGRSQQSFSAQSQANAPYYRQPHQSVTNSHHYTSQQTQSQLPPALRPDPGVYTEHQYNNTDAARGGRLHSGGDQCPFGHSHSRPEVHSHNANTAAYSNTSALGSLAYASGLGAAQTARSAPARTDSPLTRLNVNPARSQPATTITRTSTVGQPTTFFASNGQYPSPRSDSRNSGNSQPDGRATTQQPYTPSGDHQLYESYDIRLGQAQHQGQNHQHFGNDTKHSKASSDLQRGTGSSSDVGQPRPQLAGVAPSGTSSQRAGHADIGQQRMATHANKLQSSAQPQTLKAPTGGHPDHYSRNSGQMHYARTVNQDLPESTPAVLNVHEDDRSALNTPQHPTTVDPSHVFNHYEYQRRKTAAVTEVLAARRASEAVNSLNEQSNSLRTTATHQPKENPPSRTVASTASDEAAHASPSERDQIEDEMKTMIERMREYKAKNPTLFSQIWEQVKKGQPPHRASSQAPSSAREPGEASRSVADKTVETSFELTENGQLPSPSLTTVQHLSAVDSPPELFPDLGRFPAQRRKRYNKKSSQTVSSPQLHDTPIKDPTTSESAQPDCSHDGPPNPVQMNLSKDNLSNVGLVNLSKANASMRQVMEAFHTASAKANNSRAEPAIPLRPSSSTSSGKTIWPENKKMALAIAAKIALTSAPVNAGKKISSQDIHQLLDQNPSYTELCETLEARGFVLDRGHFARLLLAAVPDVNPGTPSHAPVEGPTRNAHTNGSSPEPEQQPSSALAAGKSLSNMQAAKAPSSTENSQTHSSLGDLHHQSISPSGYQRFHTSRVSSTPQSGRIQADRDTLPPYLSRNDSPRPGGRPHKDGLPPHQRTELQRDADPAMLPVTTKQPPIADVTVSVNAKDLSVIAPGQYSAPAPPVTNPRGTIDTLASAFHGLPQQAQQGQEHVIVKNANVLFGQPQTPLPGLVPSRASSSSGFGMLKLTDTFVPQPTIAPQSAHVSAASFPSAFASASTSQYIPSAGWPDDRVLNRGLPPAANSQNGHINLRQSPSTNGRPMYSAPSLTPDNLNTALPTREYRPVPSAQRKRTGPPSHALNRQQHQNTIPKALTKEEMSRKRNFSDIVDLTQLSEDDQEQHHAKRPQPSSETENQRASSDRTHPHAPILNVNPAVSGSSAPYPAPALPTEQQVTRNPAVQERLLGNISALRSECITPTTNSVVDLSQYKYAARGQSVQRELLKVAEVIQPMDKKNALRRSTYNAKTIAQDVLIAAGHHPNDKALNWHLFPLLTNFRYVNYGSDLSTFNWDLVDPVEQTASANTEVEDTDTADEGGATQTGQAFPARIPMRRHSTRVALTTEGDNEAVSVDVELPRLNKGVISRPHGRRPRHSETGIRFRAGDASLSGSTDNPKPQNGSRSAAKSEDTSRRLPSGAISAFHNTSISRMPAGSTQTGSTQTGSSGHINVPRVEIGPSPSQTQGSSVKRSLNEALTTQRGRPPGSTRASPSASADKASTPELKRTGRPPGSKDLTSRKSSTPSSSGHFSILSRPRGTDTTPTHPSGLRNAITPSDGIAVVIVTPSRSTINERKRKDSSREHDMNLKAAPNKKTQSSPTYKIYKCGWEGCEAELHNLETLRKHVRKLHRVKPNADGIPCLWSNCGKIRRMYDKQTRVKEEVHYPHTFSTPTLWDAHMDNKHFESTAWALGDGPSTHPSDAEASDYLSDTAGRLITPIARTTGPPDPLHLPSEPGPTRAYHNVHGNWTERDRAQAVLAACEARVAVVGPGIDRGGCTMVTPEARERLVDDAFAMRVVDLENDVPDLPGEKPQAKGK